MKLEESRKRIVDFRVRPINWLGQPWVHVVAGTQDEAVTAAMGRISLSDPYKTWVIEGWDVQEIEPDRCPYCGRHYHPMPVYTSSGGRIWVCHLEFTEDEYGRYSITEVFECRQKAEKDGYRFRPEQTPRR